MFGNCTSKIKTGEVSNLLPRVMFKRERDNKCGIKNGTKRLGTFRVCGR